MERADGYRPLRPAAAADVGIRQLPALEALDAQEPVGETVYPRKGIGK
jgi:hypothetical protein